MQTALFDNNPELSIVIPAFNASGTINRAIESLEQQTVSREKYQIIIVDDGSSDNTFELCQQAARQFSNIEVVRKENGGVSSARNMGLSLVRSKWVSFVDSDDFVSEVYVETLISEQPEKDYVIFGYYGEEPGKSPAENAWMRLMTNQIYDQATVLQWICDNRLNSPCDKRYSMHIIKQNGIQFKEGINLGEDLLFNFEYALHISEAFLSNETVYVYTDNLDGLCRKKAVPNRLAEMEYIYTTMCRKCRENALDEKYQRILNLSFLRGIARCAGQLYAAGIPTKEIKHLFAGNEMVQKVLAERVRARKDIARKILLKTHLYNVCSVVISAK